MLLEWNKNLNLVSRKDTSLSTILEKHFLDSILFLPEIETLHLTSHISIFDIGSGGGFPAVPLAIMCPTWHFTLCESTQKKAKFLNELIKELELNKRVSLINERVEKINTQTEFQNKYDIVTSRAVGKIPELIILSLPLLKNNGYLIAYKSKEAENEILEAQKNIAKYNLKIKVHTKEINSVIRKLVIISPCL